MPDADAQSIQTILEQATHGILFPSETDAPITPFFWPQNAGSDPITPQSVLAHEKLPADSPVETVAFDAFFAALAPDPEDVRSGALDPEQVKTMNALQALAKTLQKELSDLQVYRVGHINLKIFILGHMPNGDIAGVQTEAVET